MARYDPRRFCLSEIQIRAAEESDLPSIRALWSQLDGFHRQLGMAFPEIKDSAEKWQSSFERTLGRFSFLWLAEKEGEVAAFLLARVKQSPAYLGSTQIGEISDLFVAKKFRGNDIGEKLVEIAMKKFQEMEMHSVEVQIQAGNDRGLDFWQRQAFDLDLSQVRKVLKDEPQ